MADTKGGAVLGHGEGCERCTCNPCTCPKTAAGVQQTSSGGGDGVNRGCKCGDRCTCSPCECPKTIGEGGGADQSLNGGGGGADQSSSGDGGVDRGCSCGEHCRCSPCTCSKVA